MGLRVIGAGLGRTGTNSLKVALEQLLEGPCYHMYELAGRAQDVPVWDAAVHDAHVDWQALMSGFVAAVDWPACAFWRELEAANPGAIVLLSTRESAERWWQSMSETIVPRLTSPAPEGDTATARRRAMVVEMMARRFTPAWREREAALAAYARHNDDVRSAVPPARLVEWQPHDGWEPICAALGLPVPEQPFPHVNSATEFRSSQARSTKPRP